MGFVITFLFDQLSNRFVNQPVDRSIDRSTLRTHPDKHCCNIQTIDLTLVLVLNPLSPHCRRFFPWKSQPSFSPLTAPVESVIESIDYLFLLLLNKRIFTPSLVHTPIEISSPIDGFPPSKKQKIFSFNLIVSSSSPCLISGMCGRFIDFGCVLIKFVSNQLSTTFPHFFRMRGSCVFFFRFQIQFLFLKDSSFSYERATLLDHFLCLDYLENAAVNRFSSSGLAID